MSNTELLVIVVLTSQAKHGI